MSDFSMNVPERGWLPKVVTSREQQDFIFEKLLPEMKKAGIVQHENWSEFVRVSLDKWSESLDLEPVKLKMKRPGRRRTERE